jgi:CheY-like chemotaxis protein
MTAMSTQYYLEELQANIRAGDRIKAQVLLQCLPTMPAPVQHRVLFELSRCQPEFALPLLGYLLLSVHDLAVPQESIQSLLEDKLFAEPAGLRVLLQSPVPQEKKLALALAGTLRLTDVVPCLLSMLGQETDSELLVTLLSTLGAIGDAAAVGGITEYLYANAKALVTAAVHALAQINTAEAVQHLAARLGSDSTLDHCILDAFAGMGSAAAFAQLSATLRTPQAALRNYAKQLLHRLGAQAVPCLMQNLHDADVDFLVHSLNLLGTIGDARAIQPIRQLLQHAPANANVRFAAYEALGLLPLQKGAFLLAEGLADPVEHVRVAAARAIERHYNPIMIAGITNLLRQDETAARHTVQALIDAEADRLFISLLSEDVFQQQAMAYLQHEAHPDMRQHFETVLRQQGWRSLAAQLSITPRAAESAGDLLIYAVDDSRMLLRVYKTAFHHLGYEARLFEFPASAIEQVWQTKPDILFTDLNMPEITGVELTTALRTRYGKEELPIILVTTQSEGADHAAAYAAGVTTILPKPFTADDLAAVIRAALPQGPRVQTAVAGS